MSEDKRVEIGLEEGFVVSCLLILVAAYGCASTDTYLRGLEDGKKSVIKDMAEKGLTGNLTPYAEPYKYIWGRPILQEVIVPGAIRGGIFYPAHEETIIVKPSEPFLRSFD
jgi:hypothetical protein